jgi:hypothetical protein
MATLLPGVVLHALPAANQANLLGKSFFPNLISGPFMVGMRAVFYLAMVMCLVGAVASLMRGQRYIHGQADAQVADGHKSDGYHIAD